MDELCTGSNKGTELPCQGYFNRTPQPTWLKQQQFMFSQFQGLKVQDQDAGKVGF